MSTAQLTTAINSLFCRVFKNGLQTNNPFMRTVAKTTIENELHVLKTLGQVYDYSVVCDQRNNTPANIAADEVVVDVFIKPTNTVHFVNFTTIVTPTGVGNPWEHIVAGRTYE